MPQLIASVQGVEIKKIYLNKDRTTLGRNPGNDIVFNNMVVSSMHCAFDLRGLADVYVEDLGSTNGTYINGHMIKSRQLLYDQDTISIGHFKVIFLATSAPPQAHADAYTSSAYAALNATSAMPLSALDALDVLREGPASAMLGGFKVLTGSSKGSEVPLAKSVTTFGRADEVVVAVTRRHHGYFVAWVQGDKSATLNGQCIGAHAMLLADRDVLELAGQALEFFLDVT